MKLTRKQEADLKVMALENVKNGNIAIALGISNTDVQAARSRLDLTIEKAAKIETEPCGCCGSLAPADSEHLYAMPDGTEEFLCERCKLTVDFVNSFDEEEKEEEETENADEVQAC